MTIYEQRIVVFPTGQIEPGARHIVDAGPAAVAARGGRLFGAFKAVIGLSTNRLVVITEWPDDVTAAAWGHTVLESAKDGAHRNTRHLGADVPPAIRHQPHRDRRRLFAPRLRHSRGRLAALP